VSLMEEKTIQNVPVMPFALMYACISAIIGVFIGIVYAVIFGAIFASVPTSTTGLNLSILGIIFGAGAVIVVPILSFVGGLIFGLIAAALYNLLAPRIGGIKVRFKEENRLPTQQ
jgi:hypothetical protein